MKRKTLGEIAHQAVAVLFLLAAAPVVARADEPYTRSRDYDLQHSKISLRFDLENRKVIGEVTHSLVILREHTAQIALDSTGLRIHSVSVNGKPAKFDLAPNRLLVSLPGMAKAGDVFEVQIAYEGQPKKGLFFLVPDKNYPDRPAQIWTQGESEDTHYYVPTYDSPNDRLTTETILTVPADWITVSNGKLVSVSDAGWGQKIWDWKESVPSSTYLLTVVAGEFDEVKDNWRGIPLSYYAPRGRGERIPITYGRTPAMMEFIYKKVGVEYPWEKYAQVMVDDFVEEGMENSSAATMTSSSLRDPKLAREFYAGEDELIVHELAHQWFGDLVTTKDWGNVWLNEGFATYFESAWLEEHFGKELGDSALWDGAREWLAETNLFGKPIVRMDFPGPVEMDSNVYTKGGWVLYMLREQLGEEVFYRGLHHYLEANRGKNVVTADFAKAMEEETRVNIDEFLGQWVYGAGAPQFDLRYSYDAGQKQVRLEVKQTQKVEGHVGLFRVPVDVEITTANGKKDFPIVVSQTAETFSFAVDDAPLLVLFDKGGKILKSAEFHKEKSELIYQLKNATDFADRADATIALGKMKSDDAAATALGEALHSDHAWGIRALAADALGREGSPAAATLLLEALDKTNEPWVRNRIVSALSFFSDNKTVVARIEATAREDKSYRAQVAAIGGLAWVKAPNAYAILTEAAEGSSPDGVVRDAALRAFGGLGDEKALPLLLKWSAPGNAVQARGAAIASLARLQKNNHDITRTITGYLSEPSFHVRMAAVFALGARGDTEAIPALEKMLQNDDLSLAFEPYIERSLERLRKTTGEKKER